MAELVDVKTILKHIADSIKPIGFKKVGNRKWYRSNDETEQLVLLDRFRFEPKHRVYMLGNSNCSRPFCRMPDLVALTA